MLFLNPAEKAATYLLPSKSHVKFKSSRKEQPKETLFNSVLSSRTNLTNDPYQLKKSVLERRNAALNSSILSLKDKSPSKSPSPIA